MIRLAVHRYWAPARLLCTAGIGLAMAFAAALPASAEPKFEDYPATSAFNGTPVPVDKADENWQRLRDHQRAYIETESKLGPNFAGVYRVVEIGCGTGCQTIVAIDLGSGKLVFAPDAASYGTTVRIDSRLLKFNADPVNDWEAGYYQLKDGIIRPLK